MVVRLNIRAEFSGENPRKKAEIDRLERRERVVGPRPRNAAGFHLLAPETPRTKQ